MYIFVNIPLYLIFLIHIFSIIFFNDELQFVSLLLISTLCAIKSLCNNYNCSKKRFIALLLLLIAPYNLYVYFHCITFIINKWYNKSCATNKEKVSKSFVNLYIIWKLEKRWKRNFHAFSENFTTVWWTRWFMGKIHFNQGPG